MRMVAIFAFIQEPAIRPDLGGPEYLTSGAQDDPHRFVVEDERKACHARWLFKPPATRSEF